MTIHRRSVPSPIGPRMPEDGNVRVTIGPEIASARLPKSAAPRTTYVIATRSRNARTAFSVRASRECAACDCMRLILPLGASHRLATAFCAIPIPDPRCGTCGMIGMNTFPDRSGPASRHQTDGYAATRQEGRRPSRSPYQQSGYTRRSGPSMRPLRGSARWNRSGGGVQRREDRPGWRDRLAVVVPGVLRRS